MTDYAKIFSLSYDSAEVTKGVSLKTKYYSVRLIKDTSSLTPILPSTAYSVLLNGNCMDQENRKLYTFYLDTYYNQAWIFEIDIDTRKQSVVFFDSTNRIGFNGKFKIYNPRVVQGRIIWTDNNMPEYQMDVKRAKKSYSLGIGYGQYPAVTEWNESASYLTGMTVWKGRYFYRCLQNNSNTDPLVWPTFWKELCLVEEAYYSTDPINYYFAPVPPKFGPNVEYISDSQRKPNNLRQTIWQFAYRYVYMDYRKSTFSPACVPDMPDSEEEISTGLANELTELNNAIRIRINTGGEEVRKIEIIGRSTKDPSTWYLVDVIDLFDELEGTSYKSENPVSEPLRGSMTISIKVPTITSSGVVSATVINETVTVKAPSTWNYYITGSVVNMQWNASDSGLSVKTPTLITIYGGANVSILSIPSWINVVDNSDDSPLIVGSAITNGMTIALYPNSQNVGPFRTDSVILQDDSTFDNQLEISVSQLISPAIPNVGVAVHPEDPNGLEISGEDASAANGSAWISVTFTPNHPLYGALVDFTVNYSVTKDGNPVGSGNFTVRNQVSGQHNILMSDVAGPGQTIIVLVWEGTII